jgi:hypothetical protein
MSENTVGEKTVDALMNDIRVQLLSLRGVPISGIVAAGKFIELTLRDLERGIRAIQAKYDYARDAATQLYRRGAEMRAKQRVYFREKTWAALDESKAAEKVFDAVLAAVQSHGKPQQATLPLGGEVGNG